MSGVFKSSQYYIIDLGKAIHIRQILIQESLFELMTTLIDTNFKTVFNVSNMSTCNFIIYVDSLMIKR